HGPSRGAEVATELVDRLDVDPRRTMLGVARDRAVAVHEVRPDAVAEQVPEPDAVVTATVDRDGEEAVVARGGPVVVADLGLAAGAAHPPRPVAHGDAVDVHLLAVEGEAAGDVTGLVDVGAVVERRFLPGQQGSADGLEREVEREVVVLAAEAEHAAG